MERLDNFLALLLLAFAFVLNHRIVLVQKAVQICVVHENLGANEIQQREKLFQAVLERRSRDEHSSAGDESAHNLGKDGVDILDTMGLVDDDILERKFLERALFDETYLVASDAHVKVLGYQTCRDDFSTFLLRSGQEHYVRPRCPFFELARPVLQR